MAQSGLKSSWLYNIMRRFTEYVQKRLLNEAPLPGGPPGAPPGIAAPAGLPPGGPPGAPPGGGGLPPMGGGMGGPPMGGPPMGAPPGAAGGTAAMKLKGPNVWDVLEKVLGMGDVKSS